MKMAICKSFLRSPSLLAIPCRTKFLIYQEVSEKEGGGKGVYACQNIPKGAVVWAFDNVHCERRHTSTSGVRLQPLESMPTPKPKNFSKKKLKKRKERNRLSVNSKTNNRARIIDPRESIHLIMKHLPKNFPDFDAPGASSNDEGFSSEVPTSRRDENPGIVLSKVLTTMAEENENKEGDIKTDGGGDPHPKIWQLGQELYKTEEGVQDPNYVLYEEKDKDNLLSSGGHINETLGNKISFEKLLHPIVESLVLRTISETIQEESEEGTRLSTHN